MNDNDGFQHMGDPQRLEKFEVTNVESFCLFEMNDGDERLIAKYSMVLISSGSAARDCVSYRVFLQLGVPRKDVILCHDRFKEEHQVLYEFLEGNLCGS